MQELSAANIFLVLKTGEIVTPSLKRGTILPGVTRDTVLAMANEFKDELQPIMEQSIKEAGMGEMIEIIVSERDVCVADLLNAAEVFVTGTAAEIVPVSSIGTSETPADELDGEEEEDDEDDFNLEKIKIFDNSPKLDALDIQVLDGQLKLEDKPILEGVEILS